MNINKFGNTGTQVVLVTIKAGSQFAYGNVAGGSGQQIFLPAAQQTNGIVYHPEQLSVLNRIDMDLTNHKTKMKLDEGDIGYVLFSMYEDGILPKESVSNLIATDQNGKVIWVAERPTTNYDIYWEIYFNGGRLMALSGLGRLYEIDKNTGKILSSNMNR